MRRLIVSTILCCTLLWACAASGSNDKGKQSSLSGVSTGSSVTNRAVTVSGEVIIHQTEPADHGGSAQGNGDKKAEVQTVTDETGKKRKLKLGNINLENKEILIQCPSVFAGYTQVADGHYYYLRKEGDNCYVLYCDRGDIVGSFHLEKGYYFQGFCKYDNLFYVILYHPDSTEKDWGFGNSILAVVDFSVGQIRTLRKIDNVDVEYCEPYFYKDKIKLYEEDDVCEDVDDGKEHIYQYDIIGDEGPEHSSEKYKGYNYYTIDGYRYYAKTGKEVRIFRQNLKSQREEEIFRYQTKHPGETLDISLDMDEEDMFIFETVYEEEEEDELEIIDNNCLYTVPLSGGKMKLVTDAIEQDTDYVYNSKYIYWVDQYEQVHRWNRRTQKEEKVIKIPINRSSSLWRLDCTEEGVYIQKHRLNGISLYYMEADGDEFREIENVKKYTEEYCEGYIENYGFR